MFARAGLLGNITNHSPAGIISSALTGVAWIFGLILNIFEHKYEVRSSTYIFSYYFMTLISGSIITRTLSTLAASSIYTTNTGATDALYYAYFGLIIAGLLIESWPRGNTKVQQMSSQGPYDKANIFSRYWFHYLQKVINLGYKRPLQQVDIKDFMPQRIKTKFSYVHLSEIWDQHVAKRKAKGEEPHLMLLVLKAYGVRWVPIIIFRILASALGFVAPVLMDQLLSFLSSYSTDQPSSVSLGIILSFGMFFSTIISAMLEGQFYLLVTNMGIEARSALVSMVYRKALKLSPAAKQTQTPGEISNHMSVDAERWSEALPLLPMWFSIPFEIGVALWLLYRQIGWSSLAGLGTIVA
ncbi:hypothetical protein BGZ76_011325, partial [Entomortierella beljakovae]